MRRAVLALLVVFASCIGALAERRVALVIGNGAYTDMDTLPNPANDANAIAALLENQLRFTVVKAVDADHRAMGEVLARFASIAQDAEIAIVFYAGHGIQANGRNYLLPVSARLANQTDLITQGVRLDDIIEIMDASGARAKLLFIDACRNNPLPGGLARGASRMGLAKLEVGVIGTLIAFATAPDQIALDGSGSNSPFTSALLAYLGAPGLEIRQALWRVRSSVYQSTERRQLPWVNDALMAELFLAGREAVAAPVAPAASAAPAAAAQPMFHADIAVCAAMGDNPSELILEAYLAKHPDGFCAAASRLRLAAKKAARAPEPPSSAAALPPVIAPPADLALEAPQAGNYRISSFWNHNGSVVALSADRDQRVFYYESPRERMLGAGARKGTMLFRGRTDGPGYAGDAYLFSRRCGAISYPVRGVVSPDRLTVTLRGRAPRRDDDCRVVGWRDDRLVFSYRSRN